MRDESGRGVESRIVRVRARIRLDESIKGREVGLLAGAVLQREEQGKVAIGFAGRDIDDGCGNISINRRPASADFCDGICQRFRQIGLERIDTGEPVSIEVF
jgi:hypothetical protein